jgi:hypothetical protein
VIATKACPGRWPARVQKNSACERVSIVPPEFDETMYSALAASSRAAKAAMASGLVN